jgi:glutaredoxin-related protein
MSSILYYSNYCEHSKKIVQYLTKANLGNEVHFICIDNRTKQDNKTFIILANGQKIIMPETVNRVPALLLLNNKYDVLFGENILQHFKPKQTEMVKQATFNNTEPVAFSFSGGGGVVSDQYSFLDMAPEELSSKGNGGMRQMHNYVDINYVDRMNNYDEDNYKGSNRISSDISIEQLQQQRDAEFSAIAQQQKQAAQFQAMPQPQLQQRR